MKRNFSALILASILGLLIVAIGLGFLFGPANPVPWILIAVLVIIILVYRHVSTKHQVKWKDSYSVGVSSLDEDHKKLIELLNQFQIAYKYHTGEEYERHALNELVNYTKYHFEREERMMAEREYPDLEAHKKLHRDMVMEVEKFLKEYESRGHEALEGVATYLSDWLINHINGIDKKYQSYLA
ncbi:MAG: hemerythrin family protein [Gammaproteobacteria bacterium]|nr:hemerythrin family protein [Gammaproteobacteria bacterium]